MLVVLALAGLTAAGWLWLHEKPRGETLAQTPVAAAVDEPPPPILPGQPTIPIPVPEPPLPPPRAARAVHKELADIPAREAFASAWKAETHAGVAEFNA